MNWLKRDAWNRAWRTLLQTLVLVVVAPAADAALQVVQRAVVESMAGAPMDWDQVWRTALYAAGSGATMALLAYLHRTKVDPSIIPSARPPVPTPPGPRGMAQR